MCLKCSGTSDCSESGRGRALYCNKGTQKERQTVRNDLCLDIHGINPSIVHLGLLNAKSPDKKNEEELITKYKKKNRNKKSCQ